MMNHTLKNICHVVVGMTCFMLVAVTGAIAAEDTVCVQCHAGQPEHLSAPVGLWELSIHKENGNSCHGCHGGDPTDYAMAMSPERGFVGVPSHEEIPAFCGKCHVGVKEDYDSSAHGQALAAGGPSCVTCHNSHNVVKASLDLINEESCSRCHDYDRAAVIKEALSKTDSGIGELDAQLKELHKKGVSTREMEGQLFSLRNEYHQLFHSVDVDLVVAKSAGFQARLDEILALAMSDQDDLGKRKVFGGIVIALLVLAGVLLLMVKRTYEGGD
jgi:hypothetical protein